MKMKFVFVLAAFVATIASCKKEKSNDNPNNGDTTDYQPASVGSTWNYNSSTQGDYTETITKVIDTTIITQAGSQHFFGIDNSDGTRRYVNKTNGIYTSVGYVAAIDSSVTLQYLQDRHAGTTWSQKTTYSGFPISLNYTVASRDADKTVNAIVYKNVIGLNYAVVVSIPLAGTVTIASGQSFYAKGVGLITQITNTNTTLPGVPQISDTTILMSASIK